MDITDEQRVFCWTRRTKEHNFCMELGQCWLSFFEGNQSHDFSNFILTDKKSHLFQVQKFYITTHGFLSFSTRLHNLMYKTQYIAPLRVKLDPSRSENASINYLMEEKRWEMTSSSWIESMLASNPVTSQSLNTISNFNVHFIISV